MVSQLIDFPFATTLLYELRRGAKASKLSNYYNIAGSINPMESVIKELIKAMFRKAGLRISRYSPKGFNRQHLSEICVANTVIDIGVAFGTDELYAAFPKAKFILIEPLEEEYSEAHNKISEKYDCDIYYKGLGRAEGSQEFMVNRDNLQMSSFINRTSLYQRDPSLEIKQIDITTLDNIFYPLYESNKIDAPILLKIDTEGYELEVLQGAMKSLLVIDTVIMEVSVAKRFENSYTFEEIIRFMDDNGFHVYSFLDIIHPNDDLTTRFVDIVFKNTRQQ